MSRDRKDTWNSTEWIKLVPFKVLKKVLKIELKNLGLFSVLRNNTMPSVKKVGSMENKTKKSTRAKKNLWSKLKK
jgi:hypothetical protein